ncbi:MAG TPA: neprosin family prolyl endopeptidase [Polyangium sp.]|nr:neprosin family prolyl endopeptidase [Polyangium sp.]
MTEIENHPEWWGPIGTTVFVRPDFSKYIMDPGGATSIQDWIDNYQVPGIPDDPNRLYAGLNIVQPNVGIYARVNAFKPEVEKGSFSVIELAVVCPAVGPPDEMVGILIGMDWVNYDLPPTLDLSVERWRWVNGVRRGGYNASAGFAAQHIRPTDVGAPLEHFSTAGGEQREHALLLIMAPDGTWWVVYNYQTVGKFPASVFTTLNQGACRAQIYGEVYNPHPEQGWVRTEMGSGQYSSGPNGNVAWVREIRYFDNSVSFVNEPKSDDLANWSKPYYPPCYDRSPLTYQGSGGPIMYLGGPGGKHPTCAQKKPAP